MKWGGFCQIEWDLSFNEWEAKKLISGQKYVAVTTILKRDTWRALQSWNLRSFHINIKFALVFESQILSYKLNPISCEKISQTFVSNTERITWLIGEEIWYVCWNSSHHLCRLSKLFLCLFISVLFCFVLTLVIMIVELQFSKWGWENVSIITILIFWNLWNL